MESKLSADIVASNEKSIAGGEVNAAGAAGSAGAAFDPRLAAVAAALRAVRGGNLDFTLTEGGPDAQLNAVAREFNALLRMLATLKTEVTRVVGEVGMVGRLGPQALVPEARGDWQTIVQHVNAMAANLTDQIRCTGAVVAGLRDGRRDLRVTCESVGGELQELRGVVNELADQLAGSRA
jgi:hypothetical protein